MDALLNSLWQQCLLSRILYLNERNVVSLKSTALLHFGSIQLAKKNFTICKSKFFFFLHLDFFVCWNALIFMIKCYVRRVTTKTVIANFIKLVLLVFTGDWIICKIKRERIRVGGRREEREGKRVCSREKFKERVAIHICTKPCCCCCYLRKGSSVWIQIS